jgi:DNA adenine methylase
MAVRPIVKWAGGKTRLLASLMKHVPSHMRTYAEPFAGGAALFFALADERPRRFERAILCDANAELVACYRAVKRDVSAVIEALGGYVYDRDLYYETRDRDTSQLGDVERAARLIFLNRTCYNGLWRVNSKGKFNVPFGRYTDPRICDPDALRAASRALARAEIRCGDFTNATRGLGARDFVYFDPPYVPVSKTADFTAYAAGGFGRADQKRLVDEMRRLRRARASVVLSNADTPEAHALYEGFDTHSVKAPRPINSDKRKRGMTRELIVIASPS